MRRPAALYDIRRLLRAQLPYWSLSDLTLPPKVDPAAHGPAPRGPSPPIPPYPLIPAQKIPLSTGTGTPWVSIRIVIEQLPLQAAQRVQVARTPEALRQRHRHRILAAVQGQQRALRPQGQHRPQAAGQIRKLCLQQVADVIQCSRSTHDHTRVLWCL